MTNKNKGFTLIELLVVVLIIGILAAIALPQYWKAVEKSKVSEYLVLEKAISDAQEIVKLSTGQYTDNPDDFDIGVIPSDFTPCGVKRYKNHNTQLIVSANSWGVGGDITLAPACLVDSKTKGISIYTYTPGSAGCPASSPKPCTYCLVLKVS